MTNSDCHVLKRFTLPSLNQNHTKKPIDLFVCISGRFVNSPYNGIDKNATLRTKRIPQKIGHIPIG